MNSRYFVPKYVTFSSASEINSLFNNFIDFSLTTNKHKNQSLKRKSIRIILGVIYNFLNIFHLNVAE